MSTACFSFGLTRGTRTRRTACVISGVLLWSSLHACAQLIGIEVYEERDGLVNDPGNLAGAGSSTLERPDPDGGAPDAAGRGGDEGGRGGGASAGDGGSSADGADGADGGSAGTGGSGPLGCSPEERRCTDNVVEVCTAAGDWVQEDTCVDQTCAVSGDDAACAGECAPGQVSCQEGDAFECDRGEWDLADACTSNEVCRSGECVEARREVGNASVWSDTEFQPSETMLLYRLPALAHDAVLEHFGIVGDVDGVQARLVLYGDRPDGLAPTGGVIAQTGGLSFALAAGEVVTAAPASPETLLSAGTAYWLGVATAEATTLRGAAGAATALRIVPFAPFNAPFGPAQTGQVGPQTHLNVFIGVRELP